jgi:hydrogenase/urease accessory protein HupE
MSLARRSIGFWLTIALFLVVTTPAWTHQTGRSTFVVHIKPETRQVDTLLTCPARDVAHGAQIDPGDDGLLEPVELQRDWNRLGFYLDRRIEVLNDGKPCEPIEHRTSPSADPTSFWFLKAFECEEPLGTIAIENDAMLETTGGYRHIGRIQLGEDVHTTVFNRQSPSFELAVAEPEPPSLAETVGRFVWEGILHIVFGWDHVLFVLGLVLVSRRFKTLLVVITGFTLSHSITLALSALDVLTLPAHIVEPVIALSVAWIAIEAIVERDDPRTAYIATFLLGLVHGFGFSYVLRDEVGLPTDALVPALLSFNVGVELGQLGIIALIYPLRAWMRDRDWERRVVIGIALVVAAIALYWFVERTFLA